MLSFTTTFRCIKNMARYKTKSDYHIKWRKAEFVCVSCALDQGKTKNINLANRQEKLVKSCVDCVTDIRPSFNLLPAVQIPPPNALFREPAFEESHKRCFLGNRSTRSPAPNFWSFNIRRRSNAVLRFGRVLRRAYRALFIWDRVSRSTLGRPIRRPV